VAAKRCVASTLLLVVTFGVQVAYGAPTRSTGVLRALHCCSTRCDHAKSASAAARCCGVPDAGSELTTSPQTKSSDDRHPVQTPLISANVPAKLDAQRVASLAPVPATARAAPLFLLTRSLRI